MPRIESDCDEDVFLMEWNQYTMYFCTREKCLVVWFIQDKGTDQEYPQYRTVDIDLSRLESD